ncbi:(d)CMP kinase [Parapedobacter koreensis]|uniref:Cytidylate kinase n=1 Tax=Parapedobacter koreensis TaxID=332977 RepID=A0A1H7TSG4_9SPHI|nr:(d)CMP kinase [Parapedobacter koreensis]SEL87366.1 cytidylate kinase [Parapedobacter koreensis]
MAKTNKVIAIDGYSSCGKSTLAKALAKKLHYLYIDSGAMYRAVTLYFIRNVVPIADQAKIADALSAIHIDFHTDAGQTRILLNEEDVSEEIRQMYISDYVSEVSAIRAVRLAMVDQQQRMGSNQNIVMDGRDIGTTVFPDADLKIFMTADPKVRAERRYLELKNKGEDITLEEVFENLAHRDYIDTTREESPLVRADDAIILDNTNLNEEEQLQFVLDRL